MARKFLTPIDLTKLELQNARIQNLAAAPADPVSGQIYYNTVDATLYFWDGSAWVDTQSEPTNITYGLLSARPTAGVENDSHIYFATDNGLTYISNGTSWTQLAAFGSGASTEIVIGTTSSTDGSSTAYARADHTHAGPGFGNPSALSFGGASAPGVATTVSRSDHSHAMPAHDAAAHSAIKISDLAAPSADVSWGTSYKITNLADPTSAQHAATKNYVDTRKVTDLTAPTSSFSMNSQKITNLATPTADTDAANKGYVDNAVAGLSWKASAHLLGASNVALAGSTGTLAIDGHAALTSAEDGYRILLTGQTNASEDGIYVYEDDGTNYTLVRSSDADNYTELIGAAIFIKEGTLYGATSWVQAEHYLTSFSGQVWTQFSGQGTYTASNGVTLVGNDFRFAPKSDGGLETGASGAAVKLQPFSGLNLNSNGLAISAGEGILVGAAGVVINTSVVARKYSIPLAGSATSYTVTHNLGTRDVVVSVRETGGSYAKVEPDVVMTTIDTVTVSFAVAPSSEQYTVTVIG